MSFSREQPPAQARRLPGSATLEDFLVGVSLSAVR